MKDFMGAALLGELVAALAKSTALRESLGAIAPEDADAMIRTLVGEIERLAADGPVRLAPPALEKPALPTPSVEPAPEVRAEAPVRKPFPAPEKPQTVTPVQQPPVPAAPVARPLPADRAPQPAPHGPVPAPSVAVKSPVSQPVVSPPPVVVPAKPAPAAAPVQARTQSPVVPQVNASASVKTPDPPLPVPVPPAPPVVKPKPAVALTPEPPPPSPLQSPAARIPAPFEDERAFVIAAALIPLQDTPSKEPFVIGGEGVESGSEIFAIDHAGIRFFLSLLRNPEAGISKAGMLLLGKQESIKHRGVHERLVNALRLQSMILPAEAGTVVLGRQDLLRRVDFRLSALFEVLLGLSTLSSWRVSAYVLDAQVQKMLPAEASPARSSRHDTERARVPSSSKKTDIKTLERLLTREKKLAETILQKLAGAADHHTVEAMVNLGSGSSEDWKPILKASFEVPTARFGQFTRTVVECQDANAMFDPMLAVAGGPGSFSLSM